MKKRVFGFIRGALQVTALKRRVFFLVGDIAIIVLSIHAAFWIRFDTHVPDMFSRYYREYTLLALSVKLGYLAFFGQYQITWRFYSLKELLKLGQAVILSTLTMALVMFLLKPFPPFMRFPRSVLLLDFIFSLGLLGLLRIGKRAFREYRFRSDKSVLNRTRILIIGAGSAGEQIGREMLNNRKSKHFPIGFVDDDLAKKGVAIHGIRVLGTRRDIPDILKSHKVEEVLVAIPSGSSHDIREIVEIVRDANHVKSIKVLPGLMDLVEGEVALSDMQEIQVEDLLGRKPVTIDFEAIRAFLAGKRVLVTGAGGSIGSELVRTILPFHPKKLAVLDIDETELFNLVNRLQPLSLDLIPVVGDVRDRAGMTHFFEKYRPEVVIHSAAYKHVPILESYPEEAVKTNIMGTKILGELAHANGVEKFVNISTDKAINPTSVMGATKRVAEEMLRVLNARDEGAGTKFISVRFGNVLGSRGSVIPLFKEQIRRGGPVTVTHPEMKRYFMAISEAVLLVLAAAAVGDGGETFVLDMGEPVKIVDLARDMIRLNRLEPDVDVPIIYVGLRPGEKLFEELLSAEEGSEPTPHPKIFRARSAQQRAEEPFFNSVERLIDMSRGNCGKHEISGVLKEIVPTFVANGDAPKPRCALGTAGEGAGRRLALKRDPNPFKPS